MARIEAAVRGVRIEKTHGVVKHVQGPVNEMLQMRETEGEDKTEWGFPQVHSQTKGGLQGHEQDETSDSDETMIEQDTPLTLTSVTEPVRRSGRIRQAPQRYGNYL